MSKTLSSAAPTLKRWKVKGSANNTDLVIENLLAGINSPRALTVWLLYSNDEHTQLSELELLPDRDYVANTRHIDRFVKTAADFRDDYIATSLLSKSDWLAIEWRGLKGLKMRERRAYMKFLSCEARCRETNLRFSDLGLDPLFKGPNVWMYNSFTRKISEILGEFNNTEWLRGCYWGPGSTTSLRGEEVSSYYKFQAESGITLRCFTATQGFGLFDWIAGQRYDNLEDPVAYNLADGDRAMCVPKNAEIERVILAQPGWNCFYQLGVGSCISARLLRWGIDLRSQDRNRLLCFYGSLSGKVATVDFKSASDQIAYMMVCQSLPRDWFAVMDALRCQYGYVEDGQQRMVWEKFSAMGNGFTFPLQTLLFFAAALAVCEYLGISDETVSVFGDDVILPVEAYTTYVNFCSFLGFTIGEDKSHSTGCFRESCGEHWFDGLNCKPLYIKKRITDASSVYKLANGIRRLAKRFNNAFGCDARFMDAWRYCLRLVPADLRYRIPEGYGDGGFVSNFDEATPHVKRCSEYPKTLGWEGYTFHHCAFVPKRRSVDRSGLLIERLHSLERRHRPVSSGERRFAFLGIDVLDGELDRRDDEQDSFALSEAAVRRFSNDVDLRSATSLKVVQTIARKWNDLGPWI